MIRTEGDDWDDPAPGLDPEPVIDFEADLIDARGEDEVEPRDASPSERDSSSDDWERRIETASLDDVLDEFVELVNARDLDGLEEILAEDVDAPFLGESSRNGFAGELNDLILRNPDLVLTRGDFGRDPIVVAWRFHQDEHQYRAFGYFSLELSESDQGLIQQLELIEELPDPEDMVIEAPEGSELPEWEDWSALDED